MKPKTKCNNEIDGLCIMWSISPLGLKALRFHLGHMFRRKGRTFVFEIIE